MVLSLNKSICGKVSVYAFLVRCPVVRYPAFKRSKEFPKNYKSRWYTLATDFVFQYDTDNIGLFSVENFVLMFCFRKIFVLKSGPYKSQMSRFRPVKRSCRIHMTCIGFLGSSRLHFIPKRKLWVNQLEEILPFLPKNRGNRMFPWPQTFASTETACLSEM